MDHHILLCSKFWKDNLKNFQRGEKNEVIHKGRRIRLTDFPSATLNIEVKETKTVKKTCWANNYEFRIPYLNYYFM